MTLDDYQGRLLSLSHSEYLKTASSQALELDGPVLVLSILPVDYQMANRQPMQIPVVGEHVQYDMFKYYSKSTASFRECEGGVIALDSRDSSRKADSCIFVSNDWFVQAIAAHPIKPEAWGLDLKSRKNSITDFYKSAQRVFRSGCHFIPFVMSAEIKNLDHAKLRGAFNVNAIHYTPYTEINEDDKSDIGSIIINRLERHLDHGA